MVAAPSSIIAAAVATTAKFANAFLITEDDFLDATFPFGLSTFIIVNPPIRYSLFYLDAASLRVRYYRLSPAFRCLFAQVSSRFLQN